MRFTICAVVSLLFSSAVHAEEISEADLLNHIKILASDDFGGRKPGTAGENKTVNYIATEWQKAGLVPATGSPSWYSPVALVERTPLKQTVELKYSDGKKTKTVRIDEDQIILRGAMPFANLTNVPVVHVGYGNLSVSEMKPAVSGKIALVNRSSLPGATDFPAYSVRKANVIAAGAAGVVTVIGSQSRFNRFARRFGTERTGLDQPEQHADVEGIISAAAADKLLSKAQIDPKQLGEDAKSKTFGPIATGISANLSIVTQVRRFVSHNVIGKLPGRKPANGAVLFLGHWDHLGECRGEGEADRICNGAVDNASGIALLIETAKRLNADRLDRTIYFLATTAEESGLLGAKAFVAESTFPLDKLVAVFNVDTIALTPNGKKIAVVGRGKTAIDDDIEKVAKAEGREIDTSDKANAFVRRQDGYVFLEKNIPTLMITSAFADQELLNAYLNGRYHDADDEVDDQLQLGGAADDSNFHVALGRYFGSLESYPTSSVPNNTGE
ncbi:M20/M25/M40 family metallo-hydrolase [Parasphingorhabdus cellanae]|uniref:M20/M25/M40 family metallo-hydrolase n=1 Tax=Parasphingorhabdus cellanae TaxID=2806553 RepID=A0ABX7T353_9SPHN|nr:M20/M25/M40 family metallo-hydrolase [Parasphingorhabdus cellanae]QTD55966.1 M20/M25/M40 family metallo-hydrolase [Parasphingorhabdus cellanae]